MFPRIDGTFLTLAGDDDFWLGFDTDAFPCCTTNGVWWSILLFMEAEVVLGLPLAPFEIEEVVVGEPITIEEDCD